MLRKAPVAYLLPGAVPNALARVGRQGGTAAGGRQGDVTSFTDLARVVQTGHTAAVLPEMAAVDFDPKRFEHRPIAALKSDTLALIANLRSLDRSGIAPGVETKLADLSRLG